MILLLVRARLVTTVLALLQMTAVVAVVTVELARDRLNRAGSSVSLAVVVLVTLAVAVLASAVSKFAAL
jgi:hypothetical protein